MARTLEDFVREALAVVDEIPPEEAKRILEQPDRAGWHLLDVHADLKHPKRDPWLAERDRKLVLYCGGGHRSALAARTLGEMGFSRAVSMAEGWAGWTRRDYPTER